MRKKMRVAGSLLLAAIVATGLAMIPQKQVAATGDVTIDETNFPDECFRREWVEFYDKNSDGVLSEEEASAVEKIDTSFKSKLITDLKGIEYFTEITELNCNSNNLTSLDVSKNTKLKRLYCGATKLTSLDVSKTTELQGLFCGSSGLTSLDVSKNVNLTALDCSYNELTSLDISQNTKLESLDCSNNLLTNLDVSMLADLDKFDCSGNQLDSLDLSKNAKLRIFDCNNTKLASLDVSKNVDLAFFYCNGNELTELNIYNNKKLINLNCSDNQLSSLYVSHLTNLEKIDCSRNRLKSLDIGKKDKLMFLYCYGNEIKDLNVKDAYFINLLCIYHTGNEETKDGIKIYRYYDDDGGIDIISELEIDLFTKMWTNKIQPTPTPTPAPNSVSVEIDLSKGEIPYTDNQALLDAVSALLKKCEEDGLFGVTVDNVNQIIHMDLDNNGEDDVDYLLVGYTFLKKADTCNIKDAIAFTEEQLKGTAYKSITFVFNQYYTVTFDANGGSGEMDPERAFAGKKYVLPNCEFTAPKGMEFDSWDLGLEGEAVDITADTVIKAQWKKSSIP